MRVREIKVMKKPHTPIQLNKLNSTMSIQLTHYKDSYYFVNNKENNKKITLIHEFP